MADEITVSVSLKVINGNMRFERRINSIQIDQAAVGSNGGVQEIGFAAHEVIAVGDLGTLGCVILRNLDSTNFVEIGKDVAAAFQSFTSLKPGEAQTFRFAAGVVPYAQADTGAVDLEYMILED